MNIAPHISQHYSLETVTQHKCELNSYSKHNRNREEMKNTETQLYDEVQEELSPLFLSPGNIPDNFKTSNVLKLSGALIDAEQEEEEAEACTSVVGKKRKEEDSSEPEEICDQRKKRKKENGRGKVSLGELQVFMSMWGGTDDKHKVVGES